MPDHRDSPLVPLDPTKTSLQREVLSRREMAQRLLGLTAVGLLDGMHPVWAHLLKGSALASTETSLAPATGPLLFLQPEQYAAFASLAEAIIPGSSNAQVSQFIDLLLSVDAAGEQKKFVASLSEMVTEAQTKFGSTIQKLSAADRATLLTVVSTAPPGSPPRKAFEDLKQWVVGAYYSSEAGMRELGWTPNRFFPSFPGCQHPEGHV